ncbi:atp synthase 6 kda subunit [Quercus suber]|uniref:Atp synthase 6 kDa subunit n=1 Tax=Quercus suber TaxID=58331 RepID=A0AAW0LCD0_QUESU
MRKFDPWPIFFKREWNRNWPFLVGFAITGAIITKMSLGLTVMALMSLITYIRPDFVVMALMSLITYIRPDFVGDNPGFSVVK